MTWKTSAAVAILCMLKQSNARITDEGLWDDNDWYNDNDGFKIGVRNGTPYSEDDDVLRRITAPMALEGDIPDYMTFPNVQRVVRLFPETSFDFVVPERNALYTYAGLLRAIGKFPAFCGETNMPQDQYDLDKTCKRELATLFAHFNQETGQHNSHKELPEWRQGLWHITEWACTPPQTGRGTAACDYKQNWGWAAEAYPPQDDEQYYGRGPFQLSWNYNYGAFSEVLVESSYNSRMYLLENPDQVHTDSFTVFTSALWFYMTPQSPKPSIHDVATGFMVPTAADTAAGFGPNFGVTTNIINGGQECGGGWEDQRSQWRIDYYKHFLTYFDLPAEADSTLTCGNLSNSFPTGGYGDAVAYFTDGGGTEAKCSPVKWQSPYSIYTRDDYKRCICDYFGNGEDDCPQATGDNGGNDGGDNGGNDGGDNGGNDGGDNGGNDGGDNGGNDGGDNGGNTLPDLSDPTEHFAEIWQNPNYSNTQPSRTLYQVDRSLDYIERKLTEMYAVFEAHQLIQTD